MELAQITPMILTYNEAANLADTLQRLSWAKQILVIDSFSTDQTLAIATSFPNVKVFQRQFDHFAEQCNFGLGIVGTTWVLSLDADYKCSDSFAKELRELDDEAIGYEVRFLYGIYGRSLRGALYPPRVVLYRKDQASYTRDGHAHRVQLKGGDVKKIRTPILHDDRKPLSTWMLSQSKYAKHEAEKILSTINAKLDWKDRVRKTIVLAGPLTLLYCLFYKRLLLDGWRGVFYSMQRVYAEIALSLELLDRKLRSKEST